MQQWKFHAASERATDLLGRLLADALPPGMVVALRGTLGAGKTRLVRALAVACGVEAEEVVSPTFVLCQQYQGRDRVLFHLDAYRLRDDDEFLELGPEEFFESDGLTLIEWADKVQACLPRDFLDIHIEVLGESSRDFSLRAHGPNSQAALQRLADLCNASDSDYSNVSA
jgi:tRNA threonylcarbamoyladenosine biosynthesis protein TsaE